MRGEAEDVDDVALVARVARHDAHALEALFARHHPAMYRHAVRLSHDAAAADDALQETFLAVWKHAESFRAATSVRAWLYTIARNALKRQFRKKAGEEDVVSLEALGAEAGWGDVSAVDRVRAAVEDRERVHKALASMAEPDREVLSLIDVEGLSLEEAAAALELGLPAMKSRLHRARLRFVAALAKEDGHAG